MVLNHNRYDFYENVKHYILNEINEGFQNTKIENIRIWMVLLNCQNLI